MFRIYVEHIFRIKTLIPYDEVVYDQRPFFDSFVKVF
jgi:hypothetical protein